MPHPADQQGYQRSGDEQNQESQKETRIVSTSGLE
jgi:hypothetical protein